MGFSWPVPCPRRALVFHPAASPMSIPASQSSPGNPAGPVQAGQATLPDGPKVQDQLASLAERGELRGVLDFLRALLNARVVALFPGSANAGAGSVVVTTRGILASSLAPLGERLADSAAAVVEPAAALGEGGYTIAVPVRHEERAMWVLIAQLAVPNARDLQAYLVILQTVAGYLLYREQRLVTQDVGWVLERTSGLLDLYRKAGAEEDYDKAARVAVEGLRDYLGCSRVIYSARGHLRAISGVQRVDTKSPSHQPVEAAMREAVLNRARIDFPENSHAVAHELLAKQSGAIRISTLPLPSEKGGLLLEWMTEPDRRTPALLEAALPFVPPLFRLLERARPNPAIFFIRRTWRKATASRRRAVAGGALAAIALLAFPFHYDIKCDCKLIPVVQRVVAAPFEGQLGRTRVQPGDRVKEGDILVVLDNRDLKLKEAELSAARDQALKKRDRAMSSADGADFAAAQLAALEAETSAQELALVQRKLGMLEVRAPITGVVVSGDLRRAEGQPVRQGQPLFEIAPLDAMLVEIAVPDREVGRVRAGMPMSFRLEAHGGWRGDTQVSRVYPRSEQREGANVFIAEAPVQGLAPGLRPGMKGRASVQSDRRPLVWQLGHRLADWVETTLWW